MSENDDRYGLENHGIRNVGIVYWNPSTPILYEEIVRRREGAICHLGPIVVRTGHHTGRSPDDKFIVKEPTSSSQISWDSANQPFNPGKFDGLYNRMMGYLQGRDIFVQDCYAGASPQHRVPIRIITEEAWHNLFARNMFVQINDPEKLATHRPEFTIICAPKFHASPHLDGTKSEACVIVHFGKRLILIGGTNYAGEIKKAVFTAMTYLLPHARVMPMHCAANIGSEDDVALFFGLSGTGKTTLSTDPDRKLIGDDEHGWSDSGIFNFEGGCYAKVNNLSAENEPQIYECTRRFGTILENVTYDFATRRLVLDDNSLTDNTRAAYPITHIENALRTGISGHPKNIIILTCDAVGVMPPIAKLTPEQAMYHFLSGYTAKIARASNGMTPEPEITFNTCFGASFMTLRPTVYAKMLGERIRKHNVNCWLVNTGWIGGAFGVGERIPLSLTRAMINAALLGKLEDVPMEQDRQFGLHTPKLCEGVPSEMLNPRNAWQDTNSYNEKASKLVYMFDENFEKFASDMAGLVQEAGPKLVV